MHALRTLLALLAASTAAAASTITLPGSVFDGSGGPLLSGNVYTASFLNVPPGQTLTIQAGAVLKFTSSRLVVDGTLHVQGTAGNPVYITSINDDSVGGDTNADGSTTTPAPGNWDGIELRSGSQNNVIDHAVLRYHGASGWAGVYIDANFVTASITNTAITDGAAAGINLTNQQSYPVVSNCTFANILGAPAIANARLDAVPFISNNTATGNPGGNFIHVTSPSPLADVSISANNCLGGALVMNTVLDVPAGVTLTLNQDVVAKWVSSRLIIDGTLKMLGTAGHPVVVTSYADDSVGGDTNNDGNATAAAPGNWDGIELRGGSHDIVIDHAIVRNYGASGWAGVYIDASGVTASITNTAITDGAAAGINLTNQVTYPVVSNCTFSNNIGAPAIANARIDSVPFFTNNTATGNPGGNFIHVTSPSPLADVSISANNCLGGALVMNTVADVPAGVTLTLNQDVVAKWVSSRLIIDGTLKLLGTVGHPVVVTSYADDSAGGDTNNDGNLTTGAPGNWDGIELRGGSHDTVIDHAIVRNHGASGWAGVYIDASDVTASITNTAITDGAAAGINLTNQLSYPVVSNCTFANIHGAPAVANARIDSVPFFTDNTATGNVGGNFIHVTLPGPVADVTISANNCLGGALVMNTLADIPAGVTLTLNPGVVAKWVSSRLVVDGTLDLKGTPNQPVVITSFADDSIAGDTNNDAGNTLPGKGNWDGIEFRSGSVGQLKCALVRYAGSSGWNGVLAEIASDVSLANVRVEHSASEAFRLNTATQAEDLTAWDCDNGFNLLAGGFTLNRSTAAGCGGFGINALVPQFTGEVRGCVAWGNGADVTGLSAGMASWSDAGTGITGGTGNISADPLFVDAANGNLRPSPGSPVIDRGDPAVKLGGQDLSTFPRFTDGNLDKLRRVDMGAYEYDNLELAVSATRKPGEALDILTTDHADMADLWMFVGLSMSEYDAHRFGTLFVDLLGPNQILFWPKVPEVISITVPLDIPVGTQFVWQVGGRLHAVPLSAGNLSNPVVSTIE